MLFFISYFVFFKVGVNIKSKFIWVYVFECVIIVLLYDFRVKFI